MKIAWFDANDIEKDYLREKDVALEIDFFEEPLNSRNKELAKGYDGVSVFITSKLNNETIDELDADFIACRSAGVDHVDLGAAEEKNIKVCHVPSYGSNTVAEHTFGLMLALSRKIYYAIQKVKAGDFDREGLRGFDLKGKILGVVGTGSIGREVIRRANCFRMDVLAYDAYPDWDAEELLDFDYVDLDDLLNGSDIISLHCPLTEETRHILSEEEFEKMNDVLLVNTARGELIDTDALVKALKRGGVRAAGLDVLEEEESINEDIEVLTEADGEGYFRTLLAEHRLMRRDDVLITPHNAFNSVEALESIVDTTIENLTKCRNIVD